MLMSKDLYRKLCKQEDTIPVFSRAWWLDAACGENWNVLIAEKKGRILASMPFYTPLKHIISMPHYTQTMGIWFAEKSSDTKPLSIHEHRQVVCNEFIEQLKDYKSFLQCFSPDFTDWLPFYWANYTQSTRYTYILHQIKDTETLLSDMKGQTRSRIKKAEKDLITVRPGVSEADFFRLQDLSFREKNQKNTQSSAVLQQLINAARSRKQGEIFGGFDKQENLLFAAFIVWQKSSAYYIAGGRDPKFHTSGASGLVLWNAIKYVSQYTDVFDFEGSMLQGIEQFFRGFGAVQVPYFMIKRRHLSLVDRVIIKLKNGIRN